MSDSSPDPLVARWDPERQAAEARANLEARFARLDAERAAAETEHEDDVDPRAVHVRENEEPNPPPPPDEDDYGRNGDGPEPRQRTSWWPVDLAATAKGPPIEATILARSDAVRLIYPGRLHALVGESETCKTWLAYVAAVEVARRGGHVLTVDFEDTEHTCLQRLAALGLSDDAVTERVHFIHPTEPLLDRHGRWTNTLADLTEALTTWPIELGIFDGVTEAMGLEGLNPLDNADVAHWYRLVPRRVTATGAAAAVADHVTKDRETRGRYAIGGVHKLNGLDGAGYMLEALELFAPGRTARIRVTVAKDRLGRVRAHADDRARIAMLTLSSTIDGACVTASLDPPDEGSRDDFEPTVLMEKVSRHCELYPGATKRDLRALGKGEYVDKAIVHLVDRGHLRIEQGPRDAHLHHAITPYREHGVEDL